MPSTAPIRFVEQDGIQTTDRPVADLAEFIEIISQLAETSVFPTQPVLYRGQITDCVLLPKAARARAGQSWLPEHEQFTLRDFQRHTAGRIRAQSGWFTLHHRDESGQLVALDAQKEYQPRLRRIRLCPDGRGHGTLREQLHRCGITAATLFPDLGGICDTLNQNADLAKP